MCTQKKSTSCFNAKCFFEIYLGTVYLSVSRNISCDLTNHSIRERYLYTRNRPLKVSSIAIAQVEFAVETRNKCIRKQTPILCLRERKRNTCVYTYITPDKIRECISTSNVMKERIFLARTEYRMVRSKTLLIEKERNLFTRYKTHLLEDTGFLEP